VPRRPFILALVLVVTMLGVWLAHRYFTGDPARSFYCRVMACSEVEAFDDLCSVFAEAEFKDFASRAEELTWIRDQADDDTALESLDRALRRPPTDRYAEFEKEARAAGAPEWSCPPIDRALGEF
jgi:hypothetical protein